MVVIFGRQSLAGCVVGAVGRPRVARGPSGRGPDRLRRGGRAIGRALLLDEPSMRLSPKLVEDILAVLQRLRGGGLLLVEQNACLVVENGEVAMTGASAQPRHDPGCAASTPASDASREDPENSRPTVVVHHAFIDVVRSSSGYSAERYVRCRRDIRFAVRRRRGVW
jgi:hypothetical protein